MYSKQLGDYEILDKLGAGSFGSVYKARHKRTFQICALKVIDIGRLLNGNISIPIEYIQREVKVLKKLSHPNIVGLTEYIVDGDQHILAMEYCGGPTLDKYISKRKLNEASVRNLFAQFAAGLKYMWTKNIIHRDLKPQNILFTSDSDDAQLKIIDFGFSQIRNPANLMTSFVGTPIYMAPEILQNQPYTGKSDLWSVGCILYEVLVGVAPFARATSHIDLANLHANWTSPELPNSVRVTSTCEDLLKKLMQRDPVLRIDWNEFFTHPFISNSETFAESRIQVHIAPMCRTIILNTHDLDTSTLVSVMKAHLLADGSDDAEKYDGVAAILETTDGKRIEMLDQELVSTYKEALSHASVLYLVLPLNTNKESIEDTAYEVVSAITAKDSIHYKLAKYTYKNDNQIEEQNKDTTNEMATLHSEFMELAEEMRERVRSCREIYETCRVYVECRDIQVNALQSSKSVLEKRRNELYDLSISFKKIFKEPMEEAIKALPDIVDRNIAELRRMSAIELTGLPTLQGKTLLEVVGEAEIRRVLRECIDTIIDSGRLVDSCDASLEHSHVDSKALDLIQHELDHNKRDWEAMCAKLHIVESSQDAIEPWVMRVDDHISGNASWLGFSFEDPIREGLESSRVHANVAEDAMREVLRLAQSICARKEMWGVMLGQFASIANARTQVFAAFRLLHVCGAQYYEPQQAVMDELTRLPEVVRRLGEHAAQANASRTTFEARSQATVRSVDESVQVMRNNVLDALKVFHNKFEKHRYAKGFIVAVDALAPAPVRVTMQTPEAVRAQADLISAQTQNVLLRDELNTRTAEVHAYREHARALSAQVGQSRAREWELNEKVKMLEEKLKSVAFRR